MTDDTVLKVQNVSKLYGINKPEAVKMIKNGVDKNIIHKKNRGYRCTLGCIL